MFYAQLTESIYGMVYSLAPPLYCYYHYCQNTLLHVNKHFPISGKCSGYYTPIDNLLYSSLYLCKPGFKWRSVHSLQHGLSKGNSCFMVIRHGHHEDDMVIFYWWWENKEYECIHWVTL